MAGTIKGMTIEIGGNTEPLQQALKGANKEITETQKELKEINKALKLDPSNVELLKQKQQVLNEQIGNTKTKLDALRQAQAKMEEEMKKGEDVNQSAYRKIQREIMATENSLSDLQKEAKNTHPQLTKVAESLKKAGEVAKNIAKAGFDLTVAGIKAMAVASASAVTSIGNLAIKCGQLADDLNTMSSVTGLSTKQLQEFAYASDLIDVSTDTLSSSLKKLTSNMSTASKGSGDVYDTFKKLGVQFQNNDGTLRNSNEVFNETIRALGKVKNETERDALAMKLFGKSATDLNPLIEGGIDTLERMSKQANELGLILSQEALDGANAFNDQLDILKANGKATFQVIGTEIATRLTPLMENLNNYTMEVIKSLTTALDTGGLEGLAEELSTQVGKMLTDLIEQLPKIAEFGANIVKKLVEGISQNATQIGQTASELITTLTSAFYELLPTIMQTAITILTAFAKAFAENIPTLFPIILQGLLDTLQVVIDNLPTIVETVVDVIVAIVETLTDPDNIEMLIQGAGQLIIALAEGLMKALPKLVERLPDIIVAIVRGLIALLGELGKVAITLLTKLGDFILENLAILGSYIADLWEYIKTSILNQVKGIVEIGKYIVEGLWNGIKNAKDWLIGKIQQFCSDALRSNKELLWN